MYDNNEEQNFYNQENLNSQENFTEQKKKEHNAEHKGKGTFAKKMTKCVAYAMAFGLVAGTAFEGSSYAISRFLPDKTITAEASNETDTSSKMTNVSTAPKVITTSATDVSEIVSEVMPSIVAITNMSEVQYRSFFGQMQNYENESAGSGIIVSDDDDYYYIVTNNHVVSNATTLTVQFADDSTATAEVQGTDASTDLAVVKVKKSDIEESAKDKIKVATLSDSEELLPGQTAIAIGNALGYGQSVTTGVISALEREVSIQDETTGATITNNLIQTDAAINPGNSGGALINLNGEVIGINSSKFSDTSVEGMGFAIPMSIAQPIIEELITKGSVSQIAAGGAYLGVAGVDVTSEVAQMYNLPIGAYITQVKDNSAAANAGLAQGDVITAADGQEVSSFEELKAVISKLESGDTLEITYQRRAANGEYAANTVTVTLGEYTEDATQNQTEGSGDEQYSNPFGGQYDGSDDEQYNNQGGLDDLFPQGGMR